MPHDRFENPNEAAGHPRKTHPMRAGGGDGFDDSDPLWELMGKAPMARPDPWLSARTLARRRREETPWIQRVLRAPAFALGALAIGVAGLAFGVAAGVLAPGASSAPQVAVVTEPSRTESPALQPQLPDDDETARALAALSRTGEAARPVGAGSSAASVPPVTPAEPAATAGEGESIAATATSPAGSGDLTAAAMDEALTFLVASDMFASGSTTTSGSDLDIWGEATGL